jgi:hypothetical protein
MKTIPLLFLGSLLAAFLFFSCKKNQLGGKATISGKVAHHSKPIGNARVFIKFNAKEFPGEDTTLYNDKVWADADGNYSIKCYKGDYYLWGYGFDFGINKVVTGGLPVHLRNKEKVNVDVAVSED